MKPVSYCKIVVEGQVSRHRKGRNQANSAMLLTVRRHRRLSVRGKLPEALFLPAGIFGLRLRLLPRLRNAGELQCCIIRVEVGTSPREFFAKP